MDNITPEGVREVRHRPKVGSEGVGGDGTVSGIRELKYYSYIYRYMSSPQEIRAIAERLANMVIKRKYKDIDEIQVRLDMDYDIPTYKIFVIAKKYDVIHKENEIVKDINDTIKMVGIKRRDLENIIFAMKD